jgi:hypothetical protein
MVMVKVEHGAGGVLDLLEQHFGRAVCVDTLPDI